MSASAEGHAKINQLNKGSIAITEHNVLRLDISVDQVLTVHIIDCFCNLVEVFSCFVLWEADFRLYGIKQISTLCKVLHHYIGGLGLKGSVVSSDNIGVLGDTLAVLELPLEVVSAGISFADSFNGHRFSSGFVLCNPGGPIGAFSGLLYKVVSLIEAWVASCHCLSCFSCFSCFRALVHFEFVDCFVVDLQLTAYIGFTSTPTWLQTARQ